MPRQPSNIKGRKQSNAVNMKKYMLDQAMATGIVGNFLQPTIGQTLSPQSNKGSAGIALTKTAQMKKRTKKSGV